MFQTAFKIWIISPPQIYYLFISLLHSHFSKVKSAMGILPSLIFSVLFPRGFNCLWCWYIQSPQRERKITLLKFRNICSLPMFIFRLPAWAVSLDSVPAIQWNECSVLSAHVRSVLTWAWRSEQKGIETVSGQYTNQGMLISQTWHK